jgi:hypothetical protein
MECSGDNRRAMAALNPSLWMGWWRMLDKLCINFVEVVMVFDEESGGAARRVV